MNSSELLQGIGATALEIWKSNFAMIIVVVLMALLTYRGWREGLVSMLMSLTSVILSLFLTKKFLPYFSEQVRSTGAIESIVDNFVQNNLTNNDPAGASSLLYNMLGLDSMAHDAGQKMADIVIMVISFIVLFIAITIILKIVSYILDRFADLPVISTINAVFGAALGFVESVIYTWILMTVVTLIPMGELTGTIMAQISESPLLDLLFKNNMILDFLRIMFGG